MAAAQFCNSNNNNNNKNKKSLFIFFLGSLLVFLTLIHMAHSDEGADAGFPLKEDTIDCGASCSVRCKLSSRPRLCKRACGTCCARCNCVPPGTAGNEELCPCYATMTTHGGSHKCP